ncbi:SPASM domain-containing protein [Sporolactobacillus inulinus]|uniref:SPASM domain-containing protein n=1 Tax=Sporolactobacillus inulinus TaxID=2078 RepID=UPI0002D3D934|nr:SPASM domain-containing protein [Sporolactobacillus inulinus]
MYLEKNHPNEFALLNDVDVSFDSPFEQEHNRNRGANIFWEAKKAIEICQKHKKSHTIVMCAMKWNFSEKHLKALVNLAKNTKSNVRINMMKPTERKHMASMVEPEQYYKGYEVLNSLCDVIDMTDPIVSGATNREDSKRCPCGRTSFRIHSITPDGKIPIAPCVYLHDFKVGDLITNNIKDLINSPQFKLFRKRNKNPQLIEKCKECDIRQICGGGCAAMAYLYRLHTSEERSLFTRDPYCSKAHSKKLSKTKVVKQGNQQLVHMDYLCTWIGTPK